MESLAVRAHIGHCCVSVGLLAVLHLCCTRDELHLDFSMLPRHSMAAVRCQVLLGPRIAMSASLLSDPSSPKDLSLPPQEPDRTHALSFYVTCVLASRHSGAVILWVSAVYSDCFLLLPAAQIRAGTLVARSTSLRQTSSTTVSHQTAGSLPVSIVAIRRMSHHHASALGASPGHHRLPSLPTVHCTDHVLLDECEALSTETPLQDEWRRSSSEFAECACIRIPSPRK